jgi:hypothetical protein
MKHLLICLTVLLCTSAQAQYVSGNRLLSDMRGTTQAERSFAMGFVTGVADAYDGELFCITGDANVGQLTDISRKFIENQPKHRHRSAAALVMLALVDVFPCKKGGGV